MQEDLVILLEWLNANGIDELFNDELEEKPNDNMMQALAKQQISLKAGSCPPQIRDYVDRLNNIETLVNFVNTSEVYNNFRKTASNSVVLDGDLNANVMIINDIPNDADDISGKIFSDDSGILLKNMMKSINIDKYLLLNTFFWRLPGNRNPIRDELEVCRPVVEKIISIIKPNLIILTGNYATSLLLENNKTLLNIRGKFFDYSNCYIQKPITLTGIYSPNFIIKNHTKKQDVWKILLTIKNILTNN